MAKRAAILIRCSPEEAELIRRSAREERRTISAFVLSAVMNRVQARKAMQGELRRRQERKP